MKGTTLYFLISLVVFIIVTLYGLHTGQLKF